MTNVSDAVQRLFLGPSTGTEWAPHFSIGHGACPDGYLEGCLIYFKQRANPASKQKVKVALKFVIIWVVSEVNSSRSKRPVDSPGPESHGERSRKGVAAAPEGAR